jgi:hypothetical protein
MTRFIKVTASCATVYGTDLPIIDNYAICQEVCTLKLKNLMIFFCIRFFEPPCFMKDVKLN